MHPPPSCPSRHSSTSVICLPPVYSPLPHLITAMLASCPVLRAPIYRRAACNELTPYRERNNGFSNRLDLCQGNLLAQLHISQSRPGSHLAQRVSTCDVYAGLQCIPPPPPSCPSRHSSTSVRCLPPVYSPPSHT